MATFVKEEGPSLAHGDVELKDFVGLVGDKATIWMEQNGHTYLLNLNEAEAAWLGAELTDFHKRAKEQRESEFTEAEQDLAMDVARELWLKTHDPQEDVEQDE